MGDPEFEAALARETEASLRRDPERWVIASATELGDGYHARAGSADDTALAERRRQAARRGWENRRAQQYVAEPARDHSDDHDDRWF